MDRGAGSPLNDRHNSSNIHLSIFFLGLLVIVGLLFSLEEKKYPLSGASFNNLPGLTIDSQVDVQKVRVLGWHRFFQFQQDVQRFALSKKLLAKAEALSAPVAKKVDSIDSLIEPKSLESARDDLSELQKMAALSPEPPKINPNGMYAAAANNDDDLTFFTYGDEASKGPKKSTVPAFASKKVSSRVDNVIDRHLKSVQVSMENRNPKAEKTVQQKITRTMAAPAKKKMKKGVRKKIRYVVPANTNQNFANAGPRKILPPGNLEEFRKMVLQKAKKEKGPTPHAQVEITPYIIGAKKDKELYNFQFIPRYDLNERWDDDSTGKISFDLGLANQHAVMSGVLSHRDIVPVSLDLNFDVGEEAESQLSIPVWRKNHLNGILERHNLNGLGSFLLVDLDEEVMSVNVDANFEDELFFNEKFEEVGAWEKYRYKLFVGVEEGNALLQYSFFDGQESQKIIHLTRGEIFYEFSSFYEASIETFAFKERAILSSYGAEKEIEGEEVKFFNSNIKTTKRGLNIHEINRPILPRGSRKYFEFNHLESPVFVGKWDETEVEVPDENYIDRVFDSFEIPSLTSQCLVQVDFKGIVEDIKYDALSYKGPMSFKHLYLNDDGSFTEEFTEKALKIFFLGDEQGVINLRIKYSHIYEFDEKTKKNLARKQPSEQYLRAICAKDTMVIEI